MKVARKKVAKKTANKAAGKKPTKKAAAKKPRSEENEQAGDRPQPPRRAATADRSPGISS